MCNYLLEIVLQVEGASRLGLGDIHQVGGPGQCSQSPCQDTTEILLNMSLVFRISAESQDQDGEPLLG